MTTAMKGMTVILFWAVLLLAIILMTEALLLSQLLQAFYFGDMAFESFSAKDFIVAHKMYEYFGSFTRCYLSMFELTLANWPPVTRLLAEEAGEYFMLVCVLHKLFIGFAVIGVINGVVLQETFKVASTDDHIMVRQKKRAAKLLQKKLSTLFRALDHSGNGELDSEEFSVIADIPEVKFWLASLDVETDDLQTLFNLIDDDGSGLVTIDELAARLPRIKGAARSIDVLSMNNVLKELLRTTRKLSQQHKQQEQLNQLSGKVQQELSELLRENTSDTQASI